MDPLLSAPIITYAEAIPGSGFFTSFVMKASQLPWMDETSSFVLLTTASMSEDLPSVPMIIAEDVFGGEDAVAFAIDGFTPVTRWMSAAKSNAARCTPGQSSSESRIGVPLPLDTMGNVDGEEENATQEVCPMARAEWTRASSPMRALDLQDENITERRETAVLDTPSATRLLYAGGIALEMLWTDRFTILDAREGGHTRMTQAL